MAGTTAVDEREAFRAGWRASSRTTTYDLDAAEQRFERRHGVSTGSTFAAGWTAHAAGEFAAFGEAWAAHTTTLVDIESVDAITFCAAFDRAREASDRIREATSEYRFADRIEHYLYVDGKAGFAILEGRLCYVFSLVPGRGDDLVDVAVQRGADRLDCFDGYLPRLYSRHGFVVTTREANWTPGGPDVVEMRTVDGMMRDGWTVESAFFHRDGQCDRAACAADHTHTYA